LIDRSSCANNICKRKRYARVMYIIQTLYASTGDGCNRYPRWSYTTPGRSDVSPPIHKQFLQRRNQRPATRQGGSVTRNPGDLGFGVWVVSSGLSGLPQPSACSEAVHAVWFTTRRHSLPARGVDVMLLVTTRVQFLNDRTYSGTSVIEGTCGRVSPANPAAAKSCRVVAPVRTVR
jgi:hypothetical protein